MFSSNTFDPVEILLNCWGLHLEVIAAPISDVDGG